jgi:Fe-S cluster biosynthesis and repair protein YggX
MLRQARTTICYFIIAEKAGNKFKMGKTILMFEQVQKADNWNEQNTLLIMKAKLEAQMEISLKLLI